MFSYQNDNLTAPVFTCAQPAKKDANYTLLLCYFILLIVAGMIDRILLSQNALPVLSMQAVVGYVMLVFSPTQRWKTLIPVVGLVALCTIAPPMHIFSHQPFALFTWALLGQFCASVITVIISARITQRLLLNTEVFTLRFTHVLLSCAVGFTLVNQYMTAVSSYRVDAFDLGHWQYLSVSIIGQITGIAIVINLLLMILMLKHQSLNNKPKLSTSSLWLLTISSIVVLMTLYYGGNLISYLCVFIVIPALWFCYRYRWWGLSNFVLVINVITVIYVMFVIVSLQTNNEMALLSQLGFSLSDMAWFLLGLNLIIIYINAMVYELDATQRSIEHSQTIMVKRNDEQQVLNQQIKQLNQHLINAQELHRRKLSAELKNRMEKNIHDLQQAINLLELQASLSGVANNPFTKIKSFTHYIFISVYELINWLKPEILERFGLIDTLKSQYFADKLALNNIQFDLSIQGEEVIIPQNISLALFRITQEAVNNTIKYSQASKFTVRLILTPEHIEFIIFDNGVGFDQATTSQGFGLAGMENRVKVLNGSFNLDSINKDVAGTQISINLPLRN